MRRTKIIGVLCLAQGLALAQEPFDPALSAEEKGRAIAEEADRRDRGFQDSVTMLTMELMAADGRVRTRRLTLQTLEVMEQGAGDKGLAIFHEPRDVAGTAFLSHTYINRANEQWLYLPSLRRVRRIAPANQTGAFVGSEFTYEDLLAEDPDRFDHRWLRDESCEGMLCFVIERAPRDEQSGYSRQIVWMDQVEYRPMKIEYYDQRERLEKTLTLENYRRYLDRFWRAHELTMTNHLTGRVTVLRADAFEFQTGLTQRDFEPSVLTRLR